MDIEKKYIIPFEKICMEDIALVGGKNAALGEMLGHLKEISIPQGFAITSHGYRAVIAENYLLDSIKKALRGISSTSSLQKKGKQIRKLILNAKLPQELSEQILTAYRALGKGAVAVRSSATAEDLPSASFAGQQETFLNVSSEKDLLKCCLHCFASLFTDRAIAYRQEHKIDHLEVSLSIGVQKMIRSDKASAGVIFTLDPETGFSNAILVTGSFGLGESVVQGSVTPDEFCFFKPTLKRGKEALLQKKLGSKANQIVYDKKQRTKTLLTPIKKQKQFCITDKEAFQLAKWALLIEEYYSKKNGRWMPMDIEWGKDGKTGKLYILQARPETVQVKKDPYNIQTYELKEKKEALTTGISVGSKIGQGKARLISSVKEMKKFCKGEVLVTDMTDPDWVPIMRMASAIVTNRGGRTSHAAIVSRELGLPCVVGTNNATSVIKTGDLITVDSSQSDKGYIYRGKLKYQVKTVDLKELPPCKTKILLNIGNPNEAFKLSFLPVDGVGLARQEFIISEYIRIHPMALVHFDKIKDKKIRKQIETLTFGYKDKKEFFIDQLVSGVALIAAAFYPRPVIFRFSDFKTNEYSHLIGGSLFEPKEENPMIGWRGASRYYKEGYREGFALECKAIAKVRDTLGLSNLKVMIPVCRTPEEGKKVLSVMKEHGLERGKNDLEVLMMCEIPSNVILAEPFFELFDGFSIGSNDLTQMILGVDRDSSLVSDIYDERNPAVKAMIEKVIKIGKEKGRKVGICGDAPSTYPDFVQFLIECDIDSISLSPDAVVKTRLLIENYNKGSSRKKRCTHQGGSNKNRAF
ncbi:MAG: phosphoenolpyruvate synthase [Chlamydiota bacterium]|jgi:pyruvate,water dikinase